FSSLSFLVRPVSNRAPQLLLKGSTANPRAEEQGFQATLVKSDKTFHLQKRSVQTSDSAVYYCALSDTVRRAAGGAEHKPRGHRWGLAVGCPGRGGFFSVSALACWRHPQDISSSDAQSQDLGILGLLDREESRPEQFKRNLRARLRNAFLLSPASFLQMAQNFLEMTLAPPSSCHHGSSYRTLNNHPTSGLEIRALRNSGFWTWPGPRNLTSCFYHGIYACGPSEVSLIQWPRKHSGVCLCRDKDTHGLLFTGTPRAYSSP
uniref:Immunoglobulin V-set domain-containing protein n=1 Tax=Sus scrofa TaxID=9823 RepID=A0A5G2R5H2_PIG